MSRTLYSSDSERSSSDDEVLSDDDFIVDDDNNDYEEYQKHRDDMLRSVKNYDADGRKEAQMKEKFSNDGSGFLPHENTSSSTTTTGFGNDGSSSSFPRQNMNVLSQRVKKKRKKNTTSSSSKSRNNKQIDYKKIYENLKKLYEGYKKLYEECDKEKNIIVEELMLLRQWFRDADAGNASPSPPGWMEDWGPEDWELQELQGGRKTHKKKRCTKKKSRKHKRRTKKKSRKHKRRK